MSSLGSSQGKSGVTVFPSNPYENMIVARSDLHRTFIWSGGGWHDLNMFSKDLPFSHNLSRILHEGGFSTWKLEGWEICSEGVTVSEANKGVMLADSIDGLVRLSCLCTIYSGRIGLVIGKIPEAAYVAYVNKSEAYIYRVRSGRYSLMFLDHISLTPGILNRVSFERNSGAWFTLMVNEQEIKVQDGSVNPLVPWSNIAFLAENSTAIIHSYKLEELYPDIKLSFEFPIPPKITVLFDGKPDSSIRFQVNGNHLQLNGGDIGSRDGIVRLSSRTSPTC